MKGLTARQLFEFDLTGFVIIRNFLSRDMVQKMNEVIDRSQKGEHWIKFSFLDADEVFLDVLSNPSVIAICEELLGPWFRFDNAWGFQEVPPYVGKASEGLHAGPMANQRSFFYQWYDGKPHCAQVNFSYILADVRKNDGGLVLIPGSHKLNVPYEGVQIHNEILQGNIDAAWIAEPELEAGDLLIFNEAVIHGTKSWKPKDRMRRNLYYKYCPGYMIWTKYEQIKKYAALARSEIEQNLLREPFVGYYDDQERPMWANHWRPKTVPPKNISFLQRIQNKLIG